MLKIIGRTLLVLLVVVVLAIGYVVYQLFSQFKKFDQVKLTNTTEVYDTLRFTYSRSGHILVEVGIEQTGKKYPFIMDSGASSFLFENKAEEFELESEGQALVINSSGSFMTAPIKKMGSIKLGSASFDDFTVKIQSFKSDCDREAYGLIGKDALRHLIWQINFEDMYMLMTTNEKRIAYPDNSIIVPLKENSSSHHLYASFRINGDSSRVSAMVDLGSNGVLSLKEKSVKKYMTDLPQQKIMGEGSRGVGSGKGSMDEKVVLISDLAVDGTEANFENVAVDVGPSKLNMLGLGFLDHFLVTLNWSKQEMVLSPLKDTYAFVGSNYGFSTEYADSSEKVIIRSVTEGSSAEEVGLRYQDEILQVNEFTFSNIGDYCVYKQAHKGDSLKVRYKRGDEEKEVLVVKKKLFALD